MKVEELASQNLRALTRTRRLGAPSRRRIRRRRSRSFLHGDRGGRASRGPHAAVRRLQPRCRR